MTTNQEKALLLLRQALDEPTAEFRPGQWEAIEEIVEKRSRLLVVQRTGWGKSIVYFLATRLLRDRNAGCTLLISPLLALMRNQIAAAQRIGIRAATINSSNTEECIQMYLKVISNCIIKEQNLFHPNLGKLLSKNFWQHLYLWMNQYKYLRRSHTRTYKTLAIAQRTLYMKLSCH
ncbi:DEAD/DEAH box helicase [Scytonema sp. NUACC26]|uniref:DEAD/DEAH box helicase n=1 Tax=Scytonema sp. NUACC26 TaxID=3140176 RepID=UPI0038B3F517